jgi:hypothetical protein
LSAARKPGFFLEPQEVDELRQRLLDDIERVVVAVLGEPKVRGTREWRFGSNGGSLGVVMSGPKRGLWNDRSNPGKHRDLFALIGAGADWPTTLERACHIVDYRPPSHDLHLTDDQRRARAATAALDRVRLEKERAERKAAAEAITKETDAARIAVARLMVKESVPPQGTPAESYISVTRGIPLDRWPHGIAWHQGERALIASAVTRCGSITGVQIVRLSPTGQKHGGLVKQTFGRLETGRGRSAFRLPARHGADRGVLCHAEGIETGLSVWAATGLETWVALGSGLDPQPGRLNVILADDDAIGSDGATALARRCQAWNEAGIWYVIATPWETARGDRSDFNDVIQAGGVAAVRQRIELALASRPRPETTPPTVPPPILPPTITKADLDTYVVKPTTKFVDEAFALSARRQAAMVANAESHDGTTVPVPRGDQMLNAAGVAAGKTQSCIDAGGTRMSQPPPPGRLPWRTLVMAQSHLFADDMEQRIAAAYPNEQRQLYLGAERPDPSAPGFNDDKIAPANKIKMCRRYDEANAVMRAGGKIETLCGSAKRGYCCFNPEHPNIRPEDACGRKTTPIIDHGFLILAGPESLNKPPPASFRRTVDYRVPGSDERGERRPRIKQLKVDVADLLIVDETKYQALLGGANDDGTAYEVDVDKHAVPLTMFDDNQTGTDDTATEIAATSRHVAEAMQAVRKACDNLNGQPMRAIHVVILSRAFDWLQVRRDAYKFKPEMETYIRPDMTGNELREVLKKIGRHNAKIARIARLCLCIVQGSKVEERLWHRPSGSIQVIEAGDGHVLRLHWVAEIHEDWRDIPTLHVDATPPEIEIMQLWRPRLNVISRAQLAIPEWVYTRQVFDSAFSYLAWAPDDPHNPPKPDDTLAHKGRTAWNNVGWLLRFLTVKLDMYRGQGGGAFDVLAIMPMNTELALIALWQEMGGVPDRLAMLHFNSMAGVNKYQRVRYTLSLSRPLIPTGALEVMASTASGVINETVPGGLLPEVDLAYLMTDGTGRLAKSRRHPDPMTERFRSLGVTGQLIQGVGRARAPWRTQDSPLHIDLLCSEPLPMPIDDLVTKQSLQPEGSIPRWLLALGLCPVPTSKGFCGILAAVTETTENAVRHRAKRDPEWTEPFAQHLDSDEVWPDFTVTLPGWRYAAQMQIRANSIADAQTRLKMVGIGNAIVSGGPPRPPVTVLDQMQARGLILLSPRHAATWYGELFESNGGETGRVECATKAIKRAVDVANQFLDKKPLKGAKRHISIEGLVPLWHLAYLRGKSVQEFVGLYYRVAGRGQQGVLAIVDATRLGTIRAEMEAKFGRLEVFEIMADDQADEAPQPQPTAPDPVPLTLLLPATMVPTFKRPQWKPPQPPQGAPPHMTLTPAPTPPQSHARAAP